MMKIHSFRHSSRRILFSAMMASALVAGSPQTLFASVSEVQAVRQAGTVKGRVTDANGEPIIGASVLVKGSTNGVITDMDGHFVLTNARGTIVISYVGYRTQEIALNGQSNLRVTLREDTALLDEVVVVGYGTQKKATLTGAVASVGGDVLESRPVSNTAIGLQGQVPGLNITRTSARPGNEGLSIQIRGASSTNSVSPLILIDGVPTISDTEFSSLNPNDIESISVLKDASAAIYGARAAGGVILVTTKKGRKGDKLKVTYNGMVTANTPANMLPLADMRQWALAYIDASYQDYVKSDGNGGEVVTQRYTNGQVYNNVLETGTKTPRSGVVFDNYDDTNLLVIDRLSTGEPLQYVDANGLMHYFESNNWLDLIYGTTYSTQHNVNIQGSSERSRWMASLGYANDRSVITAVYDGVKKYNARLNADYDLTKWLTFNMNLSYSNRYRRSPIDGLDGNNSGMYDAPIAAAYTPSGNYYDLYCIGRSPLATMKAAGRSTQEFETFRYANTLTAQVTKDLKLTGSVSFIKNNHVTTDYKQTFYVGTPYTAGTDADGNYIIDEQLSTINGTTSSYVQERIQRTFYENYAVQADYKHTFGQKHNFAAMIGANAERSTYKNVTAKRTNLLYEGLHDLSTASSEAANQSISGGSNQWGYISYVARLNYDYAGRYMVEVLGRRDGTSKFHPDYRWSNFGAVSAGWRISEEKFVKEHAKWISNLKLRASYGVTGGAVSSLGNYDYLSGISLGTYFFNGGTEQTAYLSKMTDYSRTWEKLKSLNIGVDFALLGNRLTGSFDWYQKRNDNMLVSLTYPAVLGATAPATNDAKLRVRGWEVMLGWADKAGKVDYWVNATLSDARSMVLDYAGTDKWAAGKVSVREGYALNTLFTYKTDGYFSSYDEVEAYYEQYAGNSALSNVAQSSETTHLRPGDRKKVLIIDPDHDTTDGAGNTGSGDVYAYGDADPHFMFGLNAGAKWKNFDFSFFIQGVGRHYLLRDAGMNTCAFYANYTNILTSQLDTWTWENQDAKYARLSLQGSKNTWNVNYNDATVQNAWYARLKNITIGYTLPRSLTGKWNIEKLRFYFAGDNVAEITGLEDGYDPEKGTGTRTSLPFCRNWTVGVDLTF